MASGDKADLARAGTMELTSKEGRAYLEKNLTEWKKPLLIDQTAADKKTAGKKTGAKKTTFKDVADDDDDDDEEEEIDEDDEEEQLPAKKAAKLSKTTTMDVTTKEGKELLGGKKLGDTRQMTKAKQKASPKRANTMKQVVAEATAYGYGSPSGQRAVRKRPAESQPAAKKSPAKKAKKSTVKKSPVKKSAAKKCAMKKAGTMQNTAKEGRRIIGKEQLGDTRQVTKQKQKKQK